MYKRLLSLVSLLLFLILTSCFDSDPTEETPPISIDGTSTISLTIDTGAVSRLYFAFTSPEYITQNSVNLEIFDTSMKSVDEQFSVLSSKFSLLSTTLAEERAYFDIAVPDSSFSGRYTGILTAISGAAIDSAFVQIVLKGITPYAISISELSDTLFEVDTLETVALYVAQQASEPITEEAVTLEFYSPQGIRCDSVFTITKSSFQNSKTDLLGKQCSFTLFPQRWCYSGLYKGVIRSTIGTAQDSAVFDMQVEGVTVATVDSVADIKATSGYTCITEAYFSNYQGLDHQHVTLEITSGQDSAIVPKLYKGNIDGYSMIIGVDCATTPIGTYTGVVRSGNTEKPFTITVQSETDIQFDRLYPYSMEMGIRKTKPISCNVQASRSISDSLIIFTVSNETIDVTKHIEIKKKPFNDYKGKFEAELKVVGSCPAGDYTLYIDAAVDGTVVRDSSNLTVVPITIESVEDLSLKTGTKGELKLTLGGASNIVPNEDITMTLISHGVTETTPTVRISQFYDGKATVAVDARSAAAGEYVFEVSVTGVTDSFTVTVD